MTTAFTSDKFIQRDYVRLSSAGDRFHLCQPNDAPFTSIKVFSTRCWKRWLKTRTGFKMLTQRCWKVKIPCGKPVWFLRKIHFSTVCYPFIYAENNIFSKLYGWFNTIFNNMSKQMWKSRLFSMFFSHSTLAFSTELCYNVIYIIIGEYRYFVKNAPAAENKQQKNNITEVKYEFIWRSIRKC